VAIAAAKIVDKRWPCNLPIARAEWIKVSYATWSWPSPNGNCFAVDVD